MPNLTFCWCFYIKGDTRRSHVKQIPRLALGEPRNPRNLKHKVWGTARKTRKPVISHRHSSYLTTLVFGWTVKPEFKIMPWHSKDISVSLSLKSLTQCLIKCFFKWFKSWIDSCVHYSVRLAVCLVPSGDIFWLYLVSPLSQANNLSFWAHRCMTLQSTQQLSFGGGGGGVTWFPRQLLPPQNTQWMHRPVTV